MRAALALLYGGAGLVVNWGKDVPPRATGEVVALGMSVFPAERRLLPSAARATALLVDTRALLPGWCVGLGDSLVSPSPVGAGGLLSLYGLGWGGVRRPLAVSAARAGYSMPVVAHGPRGPFASVVVPRDCLGRKFVGRGGRLLSRIACSVADPGGRPPGILSCCSVFGAGRPDAAHAGSARAALARGVRMAVALAFAH